MLNLPSDWKPYAVVLAGIALGIYFARKQLASVASAVNPLNANNAIYGALNKAGSMVTGDANFNAGGAWYELTHPGTAAQVAALSGPIKWPAATAPAGAPAPESYAPDLGANANAF